MKKDFRNHKTTSWWRSFLPWHSSEPPPWWPDGSTHHWSLCVAWSSSCPLRETQKVVLVFKKKKKRNKNSPELFDEQRRYWYLRSRGRRAWCERRWSVCWPPWASGKPPFSSWTGCWTETRHLQGRRPRNTCQSSMSANRRWESHKKLVQACGPGLANCLSRPTNGQIAIKLGFFVPTSFICFPLRCQVIVLLSSKIISTFKWKAPFSY